MKRETFFIISASFIMLAATAAGIKTEKQNKTRVNIKAQYQTQTPTPTATATPTPTPTATPTPTEQQIFYNNLQTTLQDAEVTYTDIEYEYIGNYYITAYCPSECGFNGSNFPTGWTTASGIICHRAAYQNRKTEPTTCAVDPKLHRIGENGDLFYLPYFDRVFKAEDTGGAVWGKHLDLFYEEYSDVCSFPTGYYEVYSVKYVTKTIKVQEE